MQNSLTFPWPWKKNFFPWLFPDHGNPEKGITYFKPPLFMSSYSWTTLCIFCWKLYNENERFEYVHRHLHTDTLTTMLRMQLRTLGFGKALVISKNPPSVELAYALIRCEYMRWSGVSSCCSKWKSKGQSNTFAKGGKKVCADRIWQRKVQRILREKTGQKEGRRGEKRRQEGVKDGSSKSNDSRITKMWKNKNNSQNKITLNLSKQNWAASVLPS